MEYITLVSPRANDITGQRFGRLTVLGPAKRDKHGTIIWHCVCDCGNERMVQQSAMRYSGALSCGCLREERRIATCTKHGMANTKIHSLWKHMNFRCSNPNATGYENYGGRGIEVCKEWRDNFVTFFAYVSQLPHYGEKSYTLDRIDNSLGYAPGNVRWASKSEQAQNNRANHVVTFDGKTQCLKAWADELGMLESTLLARIKRGWSVERAFGTKNETDGRQIWCPTCGGDGEVEE